MMKNILMMLMLLVSTNVFAVDWIQVSTDIENTDYYADTESIRRDGNKVRLWSLVNYKSGKVLADNKTRYLSKLNRDEYDCFEGTSRTIDVYWYSEKMGKGDVVLSIPNLTKPAISLPPGSVGETILKAVCAKKSVSVVKPESNTYIQPTLASVESPSFKSYPVNTLYKGKAAEATLDTSAKKNYRTRLREARTTPVNFAGEYVLVNWGCGMGCTHGAAVSHKTGQVVFLPDSVCCWFGQEDLLEFQLDSRLLVANGSLSEGEKYGKFFYEFDGREFKLIHTHLLDKDEAISKSNEQAS
ncbi:MAG: hypothetical protein QX193_02000 [Methylococcales bacterium]